MKNFNELSAEEQLHVVSFIANSGKRYHYSKVEKLANNILHYEGDVYGPLSSEVINAIRAGMDRYEIYKLSMTTSDSRSLITEQANKVIKEHYDASLAPIISEFTTATQAITSEYSNLLQKTDIHVKEALHSISSIDKDLSSSTSLASSQSKELKALVSTLNIKDINSELNDKLNEIKSLRSDLSAEIDPIVTRFHTATTNLESLFQEVKE